VSWKGAFVEGGREGVWVPLVESKDCARWALEGGCVA
jgi:hypothetical protein